MTSEFAGAGWRLAGPHGAGGRDGDRWARPPESPRTASRAPEARTQPATAAARASVLVVEDDAISRRILTQLLKASGYAADSAASAEDALRSLESRPAPHVALVDLDLPGMNGMELIDRLARRDAATIPVLVTATDEESLNTALAGRRVLYLRKPVDFNRLLRLLADLKVRPAEVPRDLH